MSGSPPKPQPLPALPAPLPAPPKPLDPAVTASRTRARQRATLANRGGTVKTAGLGLGLKDKDAVTAKKSILGA